MILCFYADKNRKAIEQTVNAELHNVHDWLITNRLILNTKNHFFLIFRLRQKKMHFSPQKSDLFRRIWLPENFMY